MSPSARQSRAVSQRVAWAVEVSFPWSGFHPAAALIAVSGQASARSAHRLTGECPQVVWGAWVASLSAEAPRSFPACLQAVVVLPYRQVVSVSALKVAQARELVLSGHRSKAACRLAVLVWFPSAGLPRTSPLPVGRQAVVS